MTAEIAIMNRSGIALAADSAVTVGKERVWKHTNKIFSLSPTNDIGIMIYGSGDYIGFPWELVIKLFREHVANTKFRTVAECQIAFRQFLLSDCWRDDFSENLAASVIFVHVLEQIKDHLKYESVMEFRIMARTLAAHLVDEIDDREVVVTNCTKADFDRLFGDRIAEFAADVFQQKITKTIRNAVVEACYHFFVRAECDSDFETGVVFAGYGKDELFPVVIHTIVDGRVGDYLRSWVADTTDMNTERDSRGNIIPFAQADIFHLFVEGISVEQVSYLPSTFGAILQAKSQELITAYVNDPDEQKVELALQERDNRQLVSKLMERFGEYRKRTVVRPIMKVVATLPREEMAAMAEALVELTSLRRKVDSDRQTVAGPVDVAVISKGDGFIWIKRKHYFDIDLNVDFKYRRERAINGEGHGR